LIINGKKKEDGFPELTWAMCKHECIHKTKGEDFKKQWGICRKIVLAERRLKVNREEAVSKFRTGYKLVESVPFVPQSLMVSVKNVTLEGLYKKGCRNITLHD
jgi:hypothetical protein